MAKTMVSWKSRTSGVSPDEIAPPGFSIYRPEVWLPLLGWPKSVAHFTAQQRLQRACRILLERGCRRIILYIWRPQYGKALDLIEHDLSCYHIVDEYTFSKVEKPIEERESAYSNVSIKCSFIRRDYGRKREQ